MSTSERAFNQVKAILRKLDQSIEDARERRTQGRAEPAAPSARPASVYGRATAIPSKPAGLQRWNT
jgi:hypothetical protein